jgi:hypothetical protein
MAVFGLCATQRQLVKKRQSNSNLNRNDFPQSPPKNT